MVLFEDALGRFERLDINVVTDWTSFHYNLTRAFADQPGHRRVAVAGYRLFDHAQDSQLIDPRRPPPFASVFVRNRHVRMSIHFAWDEVSLECCPKCGLKQTCELEKETTCRAKTCGFRYRGHIQDSPIVELDDDDVDDADVSRGEMPSMGTTAMQQEKPRRKYLKNEQESPAWFSRISVSRQPEEISAAKSSTSSIHDGMSDSFVRDDFLMSGNSPPRHRNKFSLLHSSPHIPMMEPISMENCDYCDDRFISLHELFEHCQEAHDTQLNQKTMGWEPRSPQYSSSRMANAWSTDMQDISSLDVRGRADREALDDSPDPRARRPISAMAQRNSSPLSVGSGESQKTYGNFRTGVKRRAQSPIALEKVTSNERNDYPPVWDPSRIFQQWNTAFGTLPNTHPDTGERLQNSPLPTPAVLGKTHPALVDPFTDINWPREQNSHPELGQRPQSNSEFHRSAGAGYDGQSKSYTDLNRPIWNESFQSMPGVSSDDTDTRHNHSFYLSDGWHEA